MADGSVQQTDANQQNGYAKLDGSGHVTVPVTGSVAAAPANAAGDTVSSIADTAKSAATTASSAVQTNGGDASKTLAGSGLSSSVPRTIASRVNDVVNVRDFGAVLDGAHAASDQAAIDAAFSATDNSDVVIPAQGGLTWPSNTYIPASSAPVRVMVNGRLANNPRSYVNVSVNHSADWVTDFGGSRPVFSSQAFNTSNAFAFSRYEQDGQGYRLNTGFYNINDNATDYSSVSSDVIHPGLFVYSASTARSRGGQDGITQTYNSGGLRGYDSPEVAYHVTYNAYGTNWGWVQNPVLNEFNGWNCGSDDWSGTTSTVGACIRAMSEWDLDISSPERPESYYNPQFGSHSYINLGGWAMPNLTWSAGASISAHQLIDVVNSADSKTYIYEAEATGTTGTTVPAFAFNETADITDGTVTWRFKGLKRVQISKGIGIGSQKGELEFGTFLETEASSYFYNAIMDFSLANWTNTDTRTHAWVRTPANSWWDMSADGTAAGQNNHRLGISTAYGNHLSYQVQGIEKLTVDDNGVATFAGGVRLGASTEPVLATRKQIVQSNGSNNIGVTWDGNDFAINVDGTDEGYLLHSKTLNEFTYTVVAVPASSTSACAKNNTAYDTNYFYVCAATNQWIRFPKDTANW
ncbi:hypothetical protein NBRC3280_1312 [Acetobacter pasteurianus NBRC 3280]|uniref:Uncharacterized protein n=1 Tax=Acetobacter pasteurianus NBRC 3278 TaxID=1226660 RepID=A0A401X3A2_ACEPA|nr:hypothetical protein [Acetobacter pasteurianus]GCD58811.1 hypothetical protein NBRC3277_1386 [Acetobacter pasteurianus NBRC 3277]GCD62304.1 hypothetical protein NBRC3278_1397 [Acetobacter pasteurianus NBRC 3278]GCD68677.1 hypothetical protein NBRC3280_1312 [Acetobacter pasteurianus NBRC 3280]